MNEEKEELDVQETRRLIGPNSFNDDWELVTYTSELRDSKGKFFAFVDFKGDEGKIRECPHCLEFGFHYKLYAKIRKENEPVAPDDDMFGSCHNCGNTFPLYEAHYESQIRDSLQTVQNPFESNESIFLSTESSKEKRRRGKI